MQRKPESRYHLLPAYLQQVWDLIRADNTLSEDELERAAFQPYTLVYEHGPITSSTGRSGSFQFVRSVPFVSTVYKAELVGPILATGSAEKVTTANVLLERASALQLITARLSKDRRWFNGDGPLPVSMLIDPWRRPNDTAPRMPLPVIRKNEPLYLDLNVDGALESARNFYFAIDGWLVDPGV